SRYLARSFRSFVMSVDVSASPVAPADSSIHGALTLRGVSKRYRLPDRSLEVLRAINLTLEAGEFVSIVGASGCGKSTLLRLIVGLDQDYEGEIVLDGVRVS